MKERNTSQAKSREDEGAQLVLIGGLLIAVAIISIAVVIGGGLFSQSTNDDAGLSSFASQTSDQIQAAAQVGQQDLVYLNENSTLFRGAYPDEVCGELVNSTKVQQLVSSRLGEGESVVDIEVEEDCGDDKSWLVGQTNPNYELPSVNSTSPGETTAVTCEDLNEDTGFDDSSVQQEWIDQLVENNGGDVPDEDDITANDKKEALEDLEDDDSVDLTLDPIRDFDGLDLLKYAESCTSYEVTEGRESVDVVFAIDTTGSMGLDGFDDSVPIGEDYNDLYDPSFSSSEVNTPHVQVHKESYTTDSGRTYTRPDPWNVECYKEYSETGVEFPRGGSYGDTDASNRDWCEGAFFGDDFNTSVGEVGDYVFWSGGSEIVRVVSLPTGGPPAGIPEDWTQVTTPGVETDDPSQYPGGEPNDCGDADCETRRSDPGSVSVGDVLEVDHGGLSTENINEPPTGDEPVTAEIISGEGEECVNEWFFGCLEEDDIWQIEFNGNTYEAREDALSVFEFRWNEPSDGEVTVEDEDGNEFEAEEDNLDYVEYRWWPPDRLFLTQAGARAAIDDLLDGNEPGNRDSVGLVEYTTALGGDAATIRGLNELDSGYADTLKQDIDELRTGSGTDIAAGIQEGVEVLEAGSDPNKTDHIVLMTDGENTPGEGDPVDYVEGNDDIEGSLNDGITIHAIALGEGADKETMKELGNDPDDPPPGGIDDDRPNGTFIASEDPSDAEDIFEDVVGNIDAIAEGNDNATAGVSNPGETFTSSTTTSTGKVEKIYDVRMNVSDFEGNGTYRMKYVGVDSTGDKELVWKMVVDNKFIGPGSPPPSRGLGYEVRFRSRSHGPTLNRTLTVPKDPDPSVPATSNLSDPGEYVWLDLTGKSSKPRLDVGGLSLSETQDELGGTSPDDYIEDAWQKVKDEAEADEGVDIVVEHRGPNGPDPPLRRGKVRGTFSMEFEPKNDNFTKIGQLSGGNFTKDCDTGNASDLPSRCGLKDPGNNRSAVSTTQIKEVNLLVTVEGPEGVSKREIKIPPEGRYSYDIFE